MPPILFAVESAESRSLPLNAQRLVNFFTEKEPQGAKSQTPLFGAPGLSAFANTSVILGALAGLGTITGGTGYGSNTFQNVPLTGGSGSGALANITITGGAVTAAVLTQGGTGYQPGDVLSASNTNLGGTGSGFNISVATVGSQGIAQVTVAQSGLYTNQGTFQNVPIQTRTGSGSGATGAFVCQYNPSTGLYTVVAAAISTSGGGYRVGDLLNPQSPPMPSFAGGVVCILQVAALVGSAITSLGALNGGSGYNTGGIGSFRNVPLTGGSGSGAIANITITSGAVSAVALTFPGVNYQIGDILSASNANLGGTGSGFAVPVTAVDIPGAVRGSWVKQDIPYVVAGNSLYQIAESSLGTFYNVPLTGGSGTGAAANIAITNGIVTSVTLQTFGANYQANDMLSAPLGAGSGFSVPVSTIGAGGAIATLGAITGGSGYQAGSCTIIGSNIGGSDLVSMSDNGFQLCIVSGQAQAGWIYDTNTQSPTFGFQQINSPNFYPANTVSFFDGYFVFDRMGTNEMFVSNIYDGTNYNGLAFASAESQPDFITATVQNLQLLFVICQEHLELWYDAGTTPFPFARYTGAGISYGSRSPKTIIKQDGAIFFLGTDKIFYRLQSTVPIRVSTNSVEHVIAQDGDITQAYCTTYTLEGHKFIVLTLPVSKRTLVFDISTNRWHDRESWDANNASLGIWRGSTVFRAFNNSYVGDAFNGNVNLLDWTTYTELGNTIQGLAYSIPYNQDRKRLFFSRFELDIQAGVGTASGPGFDPQIMLGWSVDGANTFKPLQMWRSMGKMGQYLTRLRWLRMGNGRQFVFVISVTDPVPRVIIAAHADISVGM